MEILITGGAGFIGSKLCGALLRQGSLKTARGTEEISRIVVLDVATPRSSTDPRLVAINGDTTNPDILHRALNKDTRIVFHLAAAVSMAAEADFDLGYRINLQGTQLLLERCRTLNTNPTVVMASSAAVYGGHMPSTVGTSTALAPQTSYGVQKAIAELLINDYDRRGFLQGCCLRLPTIVVRPGRPNLAASSFASSLVREPLEGRRFCCPVPPETLVSLLSVRRVVDAFIHAASLSRHQLGDTTAVQLPGLTLPVSDMLDAVGSVAGADAASLVSFGPDEKILNIVNGWPVRFHADRAVALGFRGDSEVRSIVQNFIEDELNQRP